MCLFKIFFKNYLQSRDEEKIEFVEQFKVILLNRANRVLGICTLSTGGSSAAIVDAKHIFALALKGNSNCIIISHNHPSGNLKPGENDKSITKKIKQIGTLLDLEVRDHLIVTREGYCCLLTSVNCKLNHF